MPKAASKQSKQSAAEAAAAAAAADSSRPRPTRPFNLKGKSALEAVGKCVQVLYDEGGGALVPYLGVIVYVERHR